MKKFIYKHNILFLLAIIAIFLFADQAYGQGSGSQTVTSGMAINNSTNTISINGTQVAAPSVSGFPQGFGIVSPYTTQWGGTTYTGASPLMVASGADGVVPNNVSSTFMNGSIVGVGPASGGGTALVPVSVNQGLQVNGPADSTNGAILGPNIAGEPTYLESVTYTCGGSVITHYVDEAQRSVSAPTEPSCTISYNFVSQSSYSGGSSQNVAPGWDVNPKNFSHSAQTSDPAPAQDMVTITSDRHLAWGAFTNQPWCTLRYTDTVNGTQDSTAVHGTYSAIAPASENNVYIQLAPPVNVGGGAHVCTVTFQNSENLNDIRTVTVNYNITSAPGCSQVKNLRPNGLVSGATFNLQWDSMPGATNYWVRVNDDTASSGVPPNYNSDPAYNYDRVPPSSNCGVHYVCETVGAVTSINNIPLVNGHKYSAWVHGVIGAQACEQSAISVFQASPPPTVDLKARVDTADAPWWTANQTPSDGPLTIPNGTPARLSWSSSNATWCTLPGFSTDLSNSGVKTSPLETTTTYQIVCGNNYGQTVSDSVTIRIPGAPTTYNATCNGSQASVSWGGSTDGVAYTRYTLRAYDAAYGFPPPSYVTDASYEHITASSATFPTQPGKAYKWFVHNEASNGAWSNVAIQQVQCPYVCQAVTNLAPTGNVPGTVNLTWTQPANTNNFAVRIYDTTSTATAQYEDSRFAGSCLSVDPKFRYCETAPASTVCSGGNCTITNIPLQANKTYSYWIDSGYPTPPGANPASCTATTAFTTNPAPLPTGDIDCNGPVGPGNDSCTVGYGSTATINWGSSNSTSCTVQPSGWTGTSGSQVTPGLTNPSYTYNLVCSGPGGNNITVDSVTVTVNQNPPSTSSFTMSTPSCATVSLQWSAVSNATEYWIYSNLTNTAPDPVGDPTRDRVLVVASPATTATHSNVSAGTRYYWIVSKNASGVSSPRQAVNSATSGNSVSVVACEADLSLSDKDIIQHNGSNLPNSGFCDNSFDMPPASEVFRIGDRIRYRVRVCNSSVSLAANNIRITDSMVDVIPSGATGINDPNLSNAAWLRNPANWSMSYTGGAPTITSVTGTAPNFTLNITLPGSIAAAPSAGNPRAEELTFDVKIMPPSSFSGSIGRFQNRAVITYDRTPGNPVNKTAQTPLIYFYGQNASPEIIEVAPR